MEKLTRYHIKHMQRVAQDVISEYIMNTLIRPNGSTSFVMTLKRKDSSQFLFFSEILIISFWYQSRKIFELFCLFPSNVPTTCHSPGHTELLFCFLSLCPDLFYGNSNDVAATPPLGASSMAQELAQSARITRYCAFMFFHNTILLPLANTLCVIQSNSLLSLMFAPFRYQLTVIMTPL